MKFYNRLWFMVVMVFLSLPTACFAYVENYPPNSFKEGPPKSIKAEPVVDLDHAEFKSKDGTINVSLKEKHWDSHLLIKDGNKTLMQLHVKEAGDPPFPNEVYWTDLDGNGLKDFIVLSSYRGCGLAAILDHADIFLKKSDGNYQKISYETWGASLADFVDLKKDGKYEVIVGGYYQGTKHNYFSYDVYEIKNFKLVNADKKFKGFPKYVWLTDKPNDKNTVHLSTAERMSSTAKKNTSIEMSPMEGAKINFR